MYLCLKKLLLIIAFLLTVVLLYVSCTGHKKQNKIGDKHDASADNMYTLHVDLPFESCNNETDTNYVLSDASGNRCIPVEDTITKTGGHVDYGSLPKGNYYYTVKTIFDETIKGVFNLTKNIYTNLDPYNLYDDKDAVQKDSIIIADSIKIVLNNTKGKELIRFIKRSHGYEVTISGNTGKMEKAFYCDSSASVNAICSLEIAMIGAAAVGNQPYDYDNEFYIKANRSFSQETGIEDEFYETAVRNFYRQIRETKSLVK